MTQAFWQHTVWFVVLGLLTFIQIGLFLKKAADKHHTIALFLITSGVTFSVELVIYCFFRVYDYFPMIFPNSPIDDGLAGNLFSQFSLTSTALIIAVYRLKFHWMVFYAGIYYGIEELFLYLGIYKQNYYDSWVTFLALILLLFPVTKQIYQHRTIYTTNPWLRYLFMFFGLYTLHMPTALWIPMLTGIMKPHTDLLANEMQSYTLISALNLLLLTVVCLFVYFSHLRFIWKTLMTIGIYVVLFIFKQCHLIYIKEGWFIPFATINIFAMYLYIFILKKLMTNRSAVSH